MFDKLEALRIFADAGTAMNASHNALACTCVIDSMTPDHFFIEYMCYCEQCDIPYC